MKLPVLLCLIAGCVVPALAQRPGEMRNSLGATTVDRVAIGADDAGREALCEQIRLMSTRPRDVRILPEGVELLCDGSDATTFALRFQTAPALTEKLICDLVDKPSSLVFYQMRPIALRRGSTVTLPQELSEKLQPLGVTTVGDLLISFGFVNLELRRGGSTQPFREIGLHEAPLLCRG